MSIHLKTEFELNDLTEKEIIQNSSDENDFILLGIIVKPEVLNEKNLPKNKFKLKSLFQFNSIKKIHATAIVSVRSLYQKLLIRDSRIIKKGWDIIMELVLAYNVLTTLFFLAYQHPSGALLAIDYVTWILFIIDIGLTFFTEKISEKGLPIREFRKITWIYLKGWLVLDVLAIIPLRQGGNEDAEYYLRMVRLFKLPGVIDLTDGTGISYLLTYFSFGKREKDGTVTHSYTGKIIASLVKLFISVMFIVYFFGCFFYWFQNIVSYHKYSTGELTDEQIFAKAYDLENLPSKDVALRSSYFMLTTISTIGFGDFLPKNIYEMAFIMCIMLCGVTLFAYIMGSFNNAISYYNEATSGVDYLGNLNTWLDSLERFHGKIPEELRGKIISHFDFYFANDRLKSLAKNYWEANTIEDLVAINQDYTDLLPEETYYSILDNLFHDFRYSFKYYFENAKFFYAILPHVQPRNFQVGEIIYEHGKTISEIAFILEGIVSIGLNIGGNHQTFLYCEDGRTVIGDYPVLTKLKNRYDYFVVKEVIAYVINSEVFLKIADNFFKKEKNDLLAISAIREKNLKRLMNDHISNYSHESIPTEILEKQENEKATKRKVQSEYSEDFIDQSLNAIEAKTQEITFEMKKVLNLAENISEIHDFSFENLK